VETQVAERPALIPPYGGKLIDLLAPAKELDELRKYGNSLPSIQLSKRSICDLEMLAVGAFSPVDRFLGQKDFESSVASMRLADGHIFPIPVTLPVDATAGIKIGDRIGLRDQRNNLLAVLDVEEVYEWDRTAFQSSVLGTTDPAHPLVAESNKWGGLNISGPIRVIDLPKYYDFPELRLTPQEVRSRLENFGSGTVVAFQTRNPLHRAHEELIKQALHKTNGTLLLHPVVGMTKPGDLNHFVRVRTYKELIDRYFGDHRAMLSLLPLAIRLAGPREALWHAVIRRNFGADHLIVGRDHASPGSDSHGQPFYEPYAAQELVAQFSDELGVMVVPFSEFVYLPKEDAYREASKVAAGEEILNLSGSQVRRHLETGQKIPDWHMRPEVAEILSEAHTPGHKRGFCVWFTGLSGAGKSTTAEILTAKLNACERTVTLLDGDIVRNNLSAGLGFDKAGRDANIRRIGFVASEIVRHGGVAVCAAVSPYRETRDEVRRMFPDGSFFEVFVDTPLDVCEQRDTKGMYAKARRGEIQNFTGIDDVYEPPPTCEVTLDTVDATAEENADTILDHLRVAGLLRLNV
jgi:sulfate adenylyltransferase